MLSLILAAAVGTPAPAVVDSIEVRTDPLALEPGAASVRVVGRDAERISTVADVLSRMAGVRVRRFGGLGAPATASVRGLASSQVSVLVDGLSLDTGQFGASNLADLPVEHVERIDVYRSGIPARFGDSGLGGVVNLVTSTPTGVAVNLVGGPEDTWKSFVALGGEVAGIGVSTRYRHLQTRGDFDYLDDRGTTVINDDDDRTRRRTNNHVREHSLVSRVSARPLGLRASAQHVWTARDGGIPGYLNIVFRDAFFESDRHSWNVSLETDRPWRGVLAARVEGYAVDRFDLYANPSQETGLSRNDIEHDQEIVGGRTTIAVPVPNWPLRPSATLELRRETFTPTTIGAASDEFERTRDATFAATDVDAWLFDERVQLRGGVRVRRTSDNYFGPLPFGRPPTERDTRHVVSHASPEFGAVIRVHRRATLRANRNEYARFPTLFELFGTSGEVRSNPELTAEIGTIFDARLDIDLPRWRGLDARIELGAYTSNRDSLIVLLQSGSSGTFKAENLERAEARGVELEATIDIGGAATVRASFTSQDVRHVGSIPHWNDRWLPYVSAREGSVEATVRWRSVEVRGEGIAYGGYYRDPSNRTRVPGHATWHAGVRVRAHRHVSVTADLKNVTDSSVSDVYGYPLPGRSLYLGLTARR